MRASVSRMAAPFTLAAARNVYDEAYFDIPTNRNWVALTIDDSPNGESTRAILDLLAESPGSPHATFFVQGELGAANIDLLEAIKTEQHEIANHGYSNSASSEMGLTEFILEVEKTHSILSRVWDETDMKWFRPTDGKFSDQQANYLRNTRDYNIALGNAYPFDERDNNVPAAVRHIKRFVRPGAIIILHDGPERGERTLEILREVLPWLQDQGYAVKTLSELYQG